MIEAMSVPRWAIVALASLVTACSSGGEPLPSDATVTIATSQGEVVVAVEVAESVEEQARGLMGRESLPEDAGMVFLHEEPARVSFTMRGTLIPLSLGVWDDEGRLLSITDMVPCRREPCPSYDPGVEWTVALEVNLGFFEDHGVQVGDPVRLER
jgi:uncharacterized protein